MSKIPRRVSSGSWNLPFRVVWPILAWEFLRTAAMTSSVPVSSAISRREKNENLLTQINEIIYRQLQEAYTRTCCWNFISMILLHFVPSLYILNTNVIEFRDLLLYISRKWLKVNPSACEQNEILQLEHDNLGAKTTMQWPTMVRLDSQMIDNHRDCSPLSGQNRCGGAAVVTDGSSPFLRSFWLFLCGDERFSKVGHNSSPSVYVFCSGFQIPWQNKESTTKWPKIANASNVRTFVHSHSAYVYFTYIRDLRLWYAYYTFQRKIRRLLSDFLFHLM